MRWPKADSCPNGDTNVDGMKAYWVAWNTFFVCQPKSVLPTGSSGL
jgi:hypothetical protein